MGRRMLWVVAVLLGIGTSGCLLTDTKKSGGASGAAAGEARSGGGAEPTGACSYTLESGSICFFETGEVSDVDETFACTPAVDEASCRKVTRSSSDTVGTCSFTRVYKDVVFVEGEECGATSSSTGCPVPGIATGNDVPIDPAAPGVTGGDPVTQPEEPAGGVTAVTVAAGGDPITETEEPADGVTAVTVAAGGDPVTQPEEPADGVTAVTVAAGGDPTTEPEEPAGGVRPGGAVTPGTGATPVDPFDPADVDAGRVANDAGLDAGVASALGG